MPRFSPCPPRRICYEQNLFVSHSRVPIPPAPPPPFPRVCLDVQFQGDVSTGDDSRTKRSLRETWIRTKTSLFLRIDIFLSEDMESSDETAGLSLMNPWRVITYRDPIFLRHCARDRGSVRVTLMLQKPCWNIRLRHQRVREETPRRFSQNRD